MSNARQNFSVAGNAPRARRTDPATSHQAAARASRFALSHADRILRAVKHAPRQTAAYYSHMIGLTVVQIDRRLPELERKGLVRTTGVVYKGFRCWEAV